MGDTRTITEILVNGRWEPGPTLPRDFTSGGYTSQPRFIMIAGQDENGKARKDTIVWNEDQETFDIGSGAIENPRSETAAVVTYSDETC